MNIRIPEKNQKAGICYALSEDGVELPVIDITHPSFALQLDEAAIARHLEQFYREEVSLPYENLEMIDAMILNGATGLNQYTAESLRWAWQMVFDPE